MANFFDIYNNSVQLVKSIPLRSIKNMPIVIPIEYPVGNFSLDKGSAAMDGDIYRNAGSVSLANNSTYTLYFYSPDYPFILGLINYAVGTGALVLNELFEKTSLPSSLVEWTDPLSNVNRWKFPDAVTYVEMGHREADTTGDSFAHWIAPETPYESAIYACHPGWWYVLEMTNIGSQTYNICWDIYIQQQISGHESAT